MKTYTFNFDATNGVRSLINDPIPACLDIDWILAAFGEKEKGSDRAV